MHGALSGQRSLKRGATLRSIGIHLPAIALLCVRAVPYMFWYAGARRYCGRCFTCGLDWVWTTPRALSHVHLKVLSQLFFWHITGSAHGYESGI